MKRREMQQPICIHELLGFQLEPLKGAFDFLACAAFSFPFQFLIFLTSWKNFNELSDVQKREKNFDV